MAVKLWAVDFKKSDNVMPQEWASLDAFLSFTGAKSVTLPNSVALSIPKDQTYIDVSDSVIRQLDAGAFDGFPPVANLVTSGNIAFWAEPSGKTRMTTRYKLTYEPLLSYADRCLRLSGDWINVSSIAENSARSSDAAASSNGFYPFPFSISSGRYSADDRRVKAGKVWCAVFDSKFLSQHANLDMSLAQDITAKAYEAFGRPYVCLFFRFASPSSSYVEFGGRDDVTPEDIAKNWASGFLQGFTFFVPDVSNGIFQGLANRGCHDRAGIRFKLDPNTDPVDNERYGNPAIGLPDDRGLMVSSDGCCALSYTVQIPHYDAATQYPYQFFEFHAPDLATPVMVDLNQTQSAGDLNIVNVFGPKRYFSIRGPLSTPFAKSVVYFDKTIDFNVSSIDAYKNYVNQNPWASSVGRWIGVGSQAIGMVASTAISVGLGNYFGAGASIATGIAGIVNGIGQFEDLNHKPSQIIGSNEISISMLLSDDLAKIGFVKKTLQDDQAKAWLKQFHCIGPSFPISCDLGFSLQQGPGASGGDAGQSKAKLPPLGNSVSVDYYQGYRYVRGNVTNISPIIGRDKTASNGAAIVPTAKVYGMAPDDMEAVANAVAKGVRQWAPINADSSHGWRWPEKGEAI